MHICYFIFSVTSYFHQKSCFWRGGPEIIFRSFWNFNTWARNFKNTGKYDSSLRCCWALFTAWALILAAFYFLQSWVLKKRFNILFGGFSWKEWAHSWDFMRARLNIEHYSPIKPTKVGFIFIGPKLSRRSCSCQSRDKSCC